MRPPSSIYMHPLLRCASAAIHGLRNKADISIFILHPKGRVSPIQEAQMTTVMDANVHNVAVNGTFDDCQASSLDSLCGSNVSSTSSPRTLSRPSFLMPHSTLNIILEP